MARKLTAAALLAVALAFPAAADGKGRACTVKTYPGQGVDHVTAVPEGFRYNSFPPTSGPHHPVPVPWGVYHRPLSQLQLLHNLEHGGVVIQYGDAVDVATVDRLTTFYESDPDGLVLAVLPALRGKIAVTAWRHLAICMRFDAAELRRFLRAYRFKGPERLPRAAMAPGL